MPTWQRRRVRGHGLELELIDTGGSGPPVLFLHGVMGRGANWQATLRALAPRFRCLALDQRGHGRSDQPQGPYDRDAYVADVGHVLDELGLNRCALVGHSTGALNAWVYAARNPARVSALVIEDMCAAVKGGDFLDGWRRWFDSWPLPFATHADVVAHFAALRPALGSYFGELFAEHADGWRPIFRPQVVFDTLAGNEARDWWAELAAVQVPALVVRGAHSDWLTQAEAQRIAAMLPRGRLAVVDDAYHTVHVDQPQAYVGLIGAFLDEALLGSTPVRRWTDARLAELARAQYARGDAGFPLRRPALVMIDMQEEFAGAEDGPYRVPAAAARIPAMRRLLGAFRARGLPVIHTAFAATHDGLDRPLLGAAMPNRGAARGVDVPSLFVQARFVAELAPRTGEPVILKPSYGAFYDTPLQTMLHNLRAETLVIAGTLTDACVGTTARQAYERGFGAVVAADATATALPEMHDAELAILRRAFARVLDVDRIVAEIDAIDRAAPSVAAAVRT